MRRDHLATLLNRAQELATLAYEHAREADQGHSARGSQRLREQARTERETAHLLLNLVDALNAHEDPLPRDDDALREFLNDVDADTRDAYLVQRGRNREAAAIVSDLSSTLERLPPTERGPLEELREKWEDRRRRTLEHVQELEQPDDPDDD